MGQVVGVSSCIFDTPPCSEVTKTLSGTRGYNKNDATRKVCTSTSTELALAEFTEERFEFQNALLRDGKKETASQKLKKNKRIQVAAHLSKVVRTVAWIGSR